MSRTISPKIALSDGLFTPCERPSLKLLLCFLISFNYSSGLAADDDVDISVGFSFLEFHYEEFSDNNHSLNQEYGTLPGITFAISRALDPWLLKATMSYHADDVAYDGQTQSGFPVVSRSDADIFDAAFYLEKHLETLTSVDAIYGGIGYHYWRRHIHATRTDNGTPVHSLLEYYHWVYAAVGTKATIYETEKSRWQLDARLTRMLKGQLDVDFLGFGGFDDARLDLGNEWGMHFALPWSTQATPNGQLQIEPYYEQFNIGKSNRANLTINGSPTQKSVVEPKSKTQNYGIRFIWKQRF